MAIVIMNEIEISQHLYEQKQVLARIERLLSAQKETLTLEEASAYTGISKSYIYKLTSSNSIPHYKPEGKIIYFDRDELDCWLKRNRIKTNDEIEQEARSFTSKKGEKKSHLHKTR
ncbi:helix-turn-helix domain-containing protein [Spirosoma sp.]|uniref:helix-turn-helix domain-containing protein n=1 Tax=Spirosoma sp. TaxID=1899569 RepID=UPI003B3AF2FD